MWAWQDGSNGADVATGIAVGADGSVVVVGETYGDWDIPNLGNGDMAAFKLDADGTLLWRWQGGTDMSDSANIVVMADDGSVLLAGDSGGDLVGVNPGVSASSDLSATIAIKLDSKGAAVWRWQDVPGNGYRGVHAMSLTKDGSVVIAAPARNINGENEVDAVKLDADGYVVRRWQNGASEDEHFLASAVQADGTFVLGGRARHNWRSSNAGLYCCTVVALDADGDKTWRWQGDSGDMEEACGYEVIDAMAAGCGARITLAGNTLWLWVDTNNGQGECIVLMLDTGAFVTSLQHGTHAPSTPTAPAPASSATTPSTSSIRSSQFGSADFVATPVAEAATTRSLQVETPLPTPTPPTVTPSALSPVASINPVPTPTPPTVTPSAPSPVASINPVPGVTLAPAVSVTIDPVPTRVPGTTLAPASTPSSTSSSFNEGSDIAPSGSFVSPIAVTVAPSSAATSSSPQGGADSTPIIAGLASAVAVFALLALVVFLRKQHIVFKTKPSRQGALPVVLADESSIPPPLHQDIHPRPEYLPNNIAAENIKGVEGSDQSLPDYFIENAPPAAEPATSERKAGGGSGDGGIVASEKGGSRPAFHDEKYAGGGSGGRQGFIAGRHAEDGSSTPALTVSAFPPEMSAGERNEFSAALGENEATSSTDVRGSFGGLGLGQAVGDAANDLARNCSIPGVSEAATALSILVGLLTNNRDNKNGIEASLRRCRSIVLMLESAAKVLGKVGDTTGKAELAIMEDVHDAIFDLVELVKTYQSKNKLSQLLMSTLFRRRQDEMGAVVDRAILGLQLGLHVRYVNDVSAPKRHVNALQQEAGTVKDSMHTDQNSIEEALSKSLAEARTARRQRKLNQIEIPEEHVVITDELLGKGGFGEVFLADYNGRNAAVKVMHISHEIGRSDEKEVLDGSVALYLKRQRMKDQRRGFLRELDAMIRLRSPHTVNVYGAVTSMPDRLVLVMELLSGGDLRTMLGNRDHPLSEQKSRQIIGDICAGMEFLHIKETVHGDLKSANVLLDGAGRAKIGDFGTSRWTQHTLSTGLATFTTRFSQNTQMSLAWSAPEVLDEPGSTYASDVYSFGIVVWEVLSRELPWATESHPRNIYIRVALKGQRPIIPDDAPSEIAKIAKLCWAKAPEDRPTFSAILKQMKLSGWNEWSKHDVSLGF